MAEEYWPVEERKEERDLQFPAKDGINVNHFAAMTSIVMAKQGKSQTFKKAERLSNKRLIDLLFQSGRSINQYPIKVLFLRIEGETNCNQILVSIPKRNFKKASDRNLIKRRLREAYRTNKDRLKKSSIQNLLIAYIYIGKNISTFSEIEKAMKESMDQIIELTGNR